MKHTVNANKKAHELQSTLRAELSKSQRVKGNWTALDRNILLIWPLSMLCVCCSPLGMQQGLGPFDLYIALLI